MLMIPNLGVIPTIFLITISNVTTIILQTLKLTGTWRNRQVPSGNYHPSSMIYHPSGQPTAGRPAGRPLASRPTARWPAFFYYYDSALTFLQTCYHDITTIWRAFMTFGERNHGGHEAPAARPACRAGAKTVICSHACVCPIKDYQGALKFNNNFSY